MSAAKIYRAVSREVEAVQYQPGNLSTFPAQWQEQEVRGVGHEACSGKTHAILHALTETVVVCPGEWIVRDSDGDLSIYTPEEFEAHFEAVVE